MWGRPRRCLHSHFRGRETEAEGANFSGVSWGTQLADWASSATGDESVSKCRKGPSEMELESPLLPALQFCLLEDGFGLLFLGPRNTSDVWHHSPVPASGLNPAFQTRPGCPACWAQGLSSLWACHSQSWQRRLSWVPFAPSAGHGSPPPTCPRPPVLSSSTSVCAWNRGKFRCSELQTEWENFYSWSPFLRGQVESALVLGWQLGKESELLLLLASLLERPLSNFFLLIKRSLVFGENAGTCLVLPPWSHLPAFPAPR